MRLAEFCYLVLRNLSIISSSLNIVRFIILGEKRPMDMGRNRGNRNTHRGLVRKSEGRRKLEGKNTEGRMILKCNRMGGVG